MGSFTRSRGPLLFHLSFLSTLTKTNNKTNQQYGRHLLTVNYSYLTRHSFSSDARSSTERTYASALRYSCASHRCILLFSLSLPRFNRFIVYLFEKLLWAFLPHLREPQEMMFAVLL